MAEDAHSDAAGARGTCQRCPVCLLLDHGPDLRPEVRQHLRAAGRELAMALLAALDSADADAGQPPADQPPAGLRRVDLDEA